LTRDGRIVPPVFGLPDAFSGATPRTLRQAQGRPLAVRRLSAGALPARQPAGYVAAVCLVRRAEGFAQVRLLVEHNEQVSGRKKYQRADDERKAREPEHVPEQDKQRADIHRVADEAIEAADDQFPGRVGGRGSAASAHGEIPGAPKHDRRARQPKRDRQPAEHAEREQRRVGHHQPGGQSHQQQAGDEQEEDDGFEGDHFLLSCKKPTAWQSAIISARSLPCSSRSVYPLKNSAND
jgi:hypothetical protein